MNTNPLRLFLEIPYDELEIMNLEAKKKRSYAVDSSDVKRFYVAYLQKEKRIKAVTLGFSDLEGRFHMLDYDKQFFLKNHDSLTFDGSSIRGFSRQAESDLRILPDWRAFWWLPSDVFGPGKVLIMGMVKDRDGSAYAMDTRGSLRKYAEDCYHKHGYDLHVANEIEGFLLQGLDAERNYNERTGFEIVSKGGYYHSLPNDTLRLFIDRTAEAQRAMGFENEKDHPEVAPSQFEMNYKYSEIVNAADQIQLYKLTARQIASQMGLTATFLPKPIVGINGSGMHTNISINAIKKNLFFDRKGKAQLSQFGWDFIDRILGSAAEICLILNSSVNAYRRLDPHFEAPNEIKVSEVDRGAMIRVPIFAEHSARVEVRSVGPDANPYLALYTLIRTGLEGPARKKRRTKRQRISYLPGMIQTAIVNFRKSESVAKLLGKEVKEKYLELKQATANRSPFELGKTVKNGEILYHHEIYNQILWNEF